VSRTWVGQIVVDQHTKGRLKLLVLFNPGLAHVVAPLFVHRQVVKAKESFPLLKAGWSAALRPRSASQQAAQFPPWLSPTPWRRPPRQGPGLTSKSKWVGEPDYGHLPHHLLGVPRHAPGEDCAVADLLFLVQQESGPCHHPARPLCLGRQHQNVQNILTSKLSLTPKALAMVRLLSLMMGKPAWPEADHWRMAATLSPVMATTWQLRLASW